MAEPVPPVVTLSVLGVLAAGSLGFAIAGIVRDADWWVITRGLTSGNVARAKRFATRHGRPVRRG